MNIKMKFVKESLSDILKAKSDEDIFYSMFSNNTKFDINSLYVISIYSGYFIETKLHKEYNIKILKNDNPYTNVKLIGKIIDFIKFFKYSGWSIPEIKEYLNDNLKKYNEA